MILFSKEIAEAETVVLKMIQDLYGRRWHKKNDLYKNEANDLCIFIKNKGGDAQFSLNLTLLARLKDVLDSDFKEKHFIMKSIPSSCF